MVEGKIAVIKYLMFFFNFLFWLSGLGLIIVGAIIRDKYGDYFSYADSRFANVAVFIIAVGVIVFVVGFLGCCGAIKENYCMVTTFSVLLGIIFILEIIAGALGFAYRKKVERIATNALNKAVDDFENDKQPGARKLLNWAQQKFDCCGGTNGTRDYDQFKAKNGSELCPGKGQGVESCHVDKDCGKPLYPDNCKQKFIDFVKHNLVVIGAVALAVAFIQLLGIIFACCLMKAIKGEYEVV